MSTLNYPDKQEKKPSKVWSVIAWVVVVLGFFMVLSSLTLDGGVAGKMGGILVTLAFVMPAAWLLFRRFQDRKAQDNYAVAVESENQLQQILGNENSGYTASMAALTPPERKPRRWGVVATTAVAALVVGGLISPTPESPEIQPAAEETVSATPTPDNRAEEEREGKESRARESEKREAEASEKRAAEESEKREAEESKKREAERLEAEEAAREQARMDEEAREREAQAERDRIAQEQAERDRIAQEQAAAAEQERIRNEQQQQQIQQFAPVAPAPAPVASNYKNCTAVWNAIGRPITTADSGYASHLDRDGDGIGCENDPR